MNINIKFKSKKFLRANNDIKSEVESELSKIITKYPKLVNDSSLHVTIDITKEKVIKIKAHLTFISRKEMDIIVHCQEKSLSKAVHEIHSKVIKQLEKIHAKTAHY